MAQQEEGGWPLGLQPLNVRGVGLPRNGEFFSGSVSFNTLHTASPASSTDSSSDLDTESTGSFFHDRSITLGSLIGASNIFELSRKSSTLQKVAVKDKKSNKKTTTWFFSLCSRDTTGAQNANKSLPSLGHFLAVERRAANGCRRNTPSPTIYGADELSLGQSALERDPLFINGHVAPPLAGQWHESDAERGINGELEHGNGHGGPVLFGCICGKLT